MRRKLSILPLVLVLLVVQVAPIPLWAAGKAAPAAAPQTASAAALPVVGAPSVPYLSITDQIGGDTTATAVDAARGWLYANQGPRVIKWGLAGGLPATTTDPLAKSTPLAGIPTDLKVSGSYLYVALGKTGLAVLDADTLALHATRTENPVYALAVGADAVYGASGATGVSVFSPDGTALWQTAPITATDHTDLEVVTSVAVDSAHLYAASSTDNAGTPHAGSISGVPILGGGTLDLSVEPAHDTEGVGYSSVAVDSAAVYAIRNGTDVTPATFYAFPLVTLGAAKFAPAALTGSSVSHMVLNTTATPALEAFVAEGTTGVDVVELSDGRVVTTTTTAAVTGSAKFIAIAPDPAGGDYPLLYVADTAAGVAIFQWEDPALDWFAPSGGDVLTPRPAETDLAADTTGQVFALSNYADLWTIDASRPTALSVGAQSSPLGLSMNAMGVFTVAGVPTLFLANGTDMLERYPIVAGSLQAPESVSGFSTGIDTGYQVVVTGTNAFVADGLGGLATVNLSLTPMEVSNRYTDTIPDSDYQNVGVWGNLAVVLDMMDGAGNTLTQTLRVLDITNPVAPSFVVSNTTDNLCGAPGSLSPALDVKITNGNIYLACAGGGVQVWEAATLTYVDSKLAGDTPVQLALSGNSLYAADGANGVARLTINADGTLTLDYEQALSQPPASLAVAAVGSTTDNVYAATMGGGLYLLQGLPPTFYTYMPTVRK